MRHHTLHEPVRALGLAVALSSMLLIGCHDEAPVPTTPLTAPQPPPPTPVGLQLSPHELRLVQGESGEYDLLFSGSAYTYQVAIGLGGVPERVMAVQELHHLTVTIPATAPVGTYPLTVTGSRANAASDTTTGLLTIVAATSPLQPNLQVWVADDDLVGTTVWAVAGGSYKSWYVKVKRGGGFNGAVSLSVEGLPLGASSSFDPPTVEPGHASTILRLAAETAGLESNITIRARGEGVPDATATYQFGVAPVWQH